MAYLQAEVWELPPKYVPVEPVFIVNLGGGDSAWDCREYEAPFQMVGIDGRVDVYGGVDTPSERVKGHATAGRVGVEARCSGPRGTFYRVRGTTGGEEGLWWGWVNADDTYRP